MRGAGLRANVSGLTKAAVARAGRRILCAGVAGSLLRINPVMMNMAEREALAQLRGKGLVRVRMGEDGIFTMEITADGAKRITPGGEALVRLGGRV